MQTHQMLGYFLLILKERVNSLRPQQASPRHLHSSVIVCANIRIISPPGEQLWPEKLSVNNKWWEIFNQGIGITNIEDNKPLKSLSALQSCHQASGSKTPGLLPSLLSSPAGLGICCSSLSAWRLFCDCAFPSSVLVQLSFSLYPSLNKYFLSFYFLLGSVLNSRDLAEKKPQIWFIPSYVHIILAFSLSFHLSTVSFSFFYFFELH